MFFMTILLDLKVTSTIYISAFAASTSPSTIQDFQGEDITDFVDITGAAERDLICIKGVNSGKPNYEEKQTSTFDIGKDGYVLCEFPRLS